MKDKVIYVITLLAGFILISVKHNVLTAVITFSILFPIAVVIGLIIRRFIK